MTVQCLCVSVRVFILVALETETERKRRMYDKIGRRISSREGVIGEIHREGDREKGKGEPIERYVDSTIDRLSVCLRPRRLDHHCRRCVSSLCSINAGFTPFLLIPVDSLTPAHNFGHTTSWHSHHVVGYTMRVKQKLETIHHETGYKICARHFPYDAAKRLKK